MILYPEGFLLDMKKNSFTKKTELHKLRLKPHIMKYKHGGKSDSVHIQVL